jgi:ABC-type nitrate/sulfonate/bicarbonate transport system permease component
MAPARLSARRDAALIRLVTLAGLLALWEALGQTRLVFGEALPPASAVAAAIAREIASLPPQIPTSPRSPPRPRSCSCRS